MEFYAMLIMGISPGGLHRPVLPALLQAERRRQKVLRRTSEARHGRQDRRRDPALQRRPSPAGRQARSDEGEMGVDAIEIAINEKATDDPGHRGPHHYLSMVANAATMLGLLAPCRA